MRAFDSKISLNEIFTRVGGGGYIHYDIASLAPSHTSCQSNCNCISSLPTNTHHRTPVLLQQWELEEVTTKLNTGKK